MVGGTVCGDPEGVGSGRAGGMLFHLVRHKVGSGVGLWVLSCVGGH